MQNLFSGRGAELMHRAFVLREARKKQAMQIINGLPALEGEMDFGFVVFVDGADLVCRNVICSWFGGPNDPDDNGETASGTPDHVYGVMGCSLPMNWPGHWLSTSGSPDPKLPWQTEVEVYCLETLRILTLPLIDEGPSRTVDGKNNTDEKPMGHALDVTEAAFVGLFTDDTDASTIAQILNKGLTRVDLRIRGGAQSLSDEAKAALADAGFPVPAA